MRELASDFSIITDIEKTHPAWSSFVGEMKGREYGYEPLWSAWVRFRDGWDAARNLVTP